MMCEDIGFCGDLEFFTAPLKEADVGAPQAEPESEPVVDDEEIDEDELERRIWRDKMRLKRLKEMNKGKEGVDAAKQRQSQEQARKEMNEGKEGVDAAKQRQSQEQARRKKM